MFPILVIAIGIAVLVFGKRLAVLGAAVGALLGMGLLHLLSPSGAPLLQLILVGSLAIIGFFVAGFAKGIISIVLLVVGALGGAAIVLAFLDLFRINTGLFDWILAIAGGVVGLILVRRYKDWAMIVLAGLIGALLVTRGLTIWLPVMEGALGTLLVIVLAGVSIAFQGGIFGKRKPAAQAPAATNNQSKPPETK
jgi:hypothetical protein